MPNDRSLDDRITELREQTALSDREAEVQARREQGDNRREIASALGVEKSTVNEYVSRITDKQRDATRTTTLLENDHSPKSPTQQDAHIFLAPCSNDHAYGHFEDTVLNQVTVADHKDTIPAEYHDHKQLSIWGTGDGNAAAATEIEPGDILAFYVGNTTYSHIATVRSVERNPTLAKSIWTTTDGDTWPYVIYLEDPVEIDLSSVDFHAELGYDITYPLGFTRVATDKVTQLRHQYGSVRAYFQEARARAAYEAGDPLPINMSRDSDSTSTLSDTSLAELRTVAEDQDTEWAESTTTTRTTYQRSQVVKEYARKRADGMCEGCGDPAPFMSQSGDPYLEVHHVFVVSDNGPDKPDAVIALCPACHRRVHYGADGNEYNRELIATLEDIEENLSLKTN